MWAPDVKANVIEAIKQVMITEHGADEETATAIAQDLADQAEEKYS